MSLSFIRVTRLCYTGTACLPHNVLQCDTHIYSRSVLFKGVCVLPLHALQAGLQSHSIYCTAASKAVQKSLPRVLPASTACQRVLKALRQHRCGLVISDRTKRAASSGLMCVPAQGICPALKALACHMQVPAAGCRSTAGSKSGIAAPLSENHW